MKIRIMKENDLVAAAEIHAKAFPRQGYSLEWLTCTHRAFPRTLCYVVEINNQVTGYIVWLQKSGFRPEAVIELEQIAIDPEVHGQGLGKALIKESLHDVKSQIAKFGSTLKHVVVSTRADNHAQNLYRSSLGAEVEATISNLFSADEVFMVARHV